MRFIKRTNRRDYMRKEQAVNKELAAGYSVSIERLIADCFSKAGT